MLINYIKLSLRLLIRNPFFTLINVIGLAVGIASFFALWQYSTSALKPDHHHKDSDRIARIGLNWRWNNNGELGQMILGVTQASIPPQLKNSFPEVLDYVRILEQAGFFQPDIMDKHGVKIVIGPQQKNRDWLFKETHVAYADRNLFEFFTIPLIHGQPETVLSGANNVALSQTTATKYFGDADPIGEQLSLNDSITLVVSGVYEDMPKNSRISYDLVVSNERLLTKWSNPDWGGSVNFIKLRPGVFVSEFESKLKAWQVDKYYPTIALDADLSLFAQPLRDVALSKGLLGDEVYHHPSRAILTTLKLVSIIVLVMAWANYINLTLNQVNSRIKEFATRKVNGATAMDLIKQFLTESFIVNVVAIGLALTMLQIVRQPLETIFEIRVAEWQSTTAVAWAGLLVAVVSGILITGVYPALVCIKRNNFNVFSAQTIRNSKNTISQLLTTAQFSTAIVLISWIFIVYLQLHHILNIDIGLNREGIVIIEGPIVKPDAFIQKVQSLTTQLGNVSGVQDVTISRYAVADVDGNKPGELNVAGTDIRDGADVNGVTENYIPFFGLKLIAGRNFNRDEGSNALIISRVAAERLGFKDPNQIVGSKINATSGSGSALVETEVVGVIEDYRVAPYFDYSNTNTVYENGGRGISLVYLNDLFADLSPEKIAVKINIKDVQSTMAAIESLYKKSFPGNVFEWRFLDDQINRAYADEKIARNQILLFTVLAIGIAILGLVATVTHRITEKTKEIGIRKILGAKAIQIGQLIVNAFLIQFLIAAFIAIPVAHYLGREYLQRYSDHVAIEWWFYLIPLAILMATMFIAIVSLLRKAANTNPVESLRCQ